MRPLLGAVMLLESRAGKGEEGGGILTEAKCTDQGRLTSIIGFCLVRLIEKEKKIRPNKHL